MNRLPRPTTALRPANDDQPRSARWLLAMPFIGALCWVAIIWVATLIF